MYLDDRSVTEEREEEEIEKEMTTTTTAAPVIVETESEVVGNWEDEVVKEEERKQKVTTALPLQGAWAKPRPAAVHEPPVVSKREDPWGTKSSKPAEPPVVSKRDDPWGTKSSKPAEPPVVSKRDDPWGTKSSKPAEPPVVSKRDDPWGTKSSKPAEPPVVSKREDPLGAQPSKPVEELKPVEPPRTTVTSYAAVSKGVSPTESPVPPVTQPSPAKGAWDGKNTRIAPKKMAYAQVASSRVSSAPATQPDAQAATKTGNTAGMVTLSIKPRSRNV